jgi:hypothetical protein
LQPGLEVYEIKPHRGEILVAPAFKPGDEKGKSFSAGRKFLIEAAIKFPAK